ncbi:hypothetical protein BSP36_053 [Bacillus phage BSP36]|nr:hypothetical protein BSP36_053 [Bacillus phage BSP36]
MPIQLTLMRTLQRRRMTLAITKREIVDKRRSLFLQSQKHYTFKKGDRRVNTPRLCVVCERPLSSLIIHENTYITTNSHTRFHLNDIFKVDVCEDINSCYRTLRQKGELTEDVNG